MTAHGERMDPWGSFEPYAQLIRSLMPRAISVSVFDAAGEMRWTSETTTGPDLVNLVVDVLPNARDQRDSAGELRSIEDSLPVYFCWLRNDLQALVAIVAVVCRPSRRGRNRCGSRLFARTCVSSSCARMHASRPSRAHADR
ncbi:MAG: hypothetical protein WDO56_23460 [Gammaproteobacteria bacterium]